MSTSKFRVAMPLPDKNLDNVHGGSNRSKYAGKYYVWDNGLEETNKYLCPLCGLPLADSGWPFTTFKCLMCNKSWYFEDKLIPDLKNPLWREVSEKEYANHT